MGTHRHDQGAGGRGLGGLGLWISLGTRFWGCAGHPFQDYVAAECCPLLVCVSITPMVSGWTQPQNFPENFVGTSLGSVVLRDARGS